MVYLRMRLLGARVMALALAVGIVLFGATPLLVQAEPFASEATEQALADAQQRFDVAQEQLTSLGSELELLTLARDETSAEIVELEAAIAETQSDIAATRRGLRHARALLAKRINASYKAGTASFLDVVLGSDSFEELVSSVYYLDKIVDEDQDSIDEVCALKEILETRLNDLDENRATLEELRIEQQWQVSEVEAKRDEAQKVLDSLDAEVKELMARRQEEIIAVAEAQRRTAEALAQAAVSGAVSSASSELRAGVVSAALDLLGVPYIYGGTYPTSGGTDCSGLIQWAFAQCGIAIPRTTYTQREACMATGRFFTDASLLQPGDIIFCNHGAHVALYLGDNRCVHEPSPGGVCSIVPLSRWAGSIVGYGFPLA